MFLASQSLRYAVLHHTQVKNAHYDLLVELTPGGNLACWNADCWPPEKHPRPITRIADHRRIYLEYQGPISGDRGMVRRIAGGSCRVHRCGPKLLVIELNDNLRIQLEEIAEGDWRMSLASPDTKA